MTLIRHLLTFSVLQLVPVRRICQITVTVVINSIFAFPALSQSARVEDPKSASAYFKTLRETYAKAQPGAIAWISDEERVNLLKLFDEKAPDKFLSKAPLWLSKHPADSKVHSMAASLSARVGKFEDSIRYRNMYFGLLASIVNSGDGKSPTTAFKVISVDEEYAILNYMGAKLKRQSLQGMCDVMEVLIDGKLTTIYFDVSIHLEAMQREFKPANSK